MPLLPIFSFTFSLFILWSIGFDLIHKHRSEAGQPQEEPVDDLLEELEPTRQEELFALLPSAIINLGWMGYVQYSVPSLLSNILFDIAPLLFVAELLLLLLPLKHKEEPAQFTNFISYALFFLQAYFSIVYLIYCTHALGTFLRHIFY
ncbi:MAG: hypothetical protein LLG02_09400 [Pelosinus sp.]|nr:hypothetical protein [Pelosinus sp.]